jgi:hypothetical protein
LLNKSQWVRKVVCLLLLGLFLSSSVWAFEVKAADGTYEKQFHWSYRGSDWSFNMSIPQNIYDSYKDVPVANRTKNGPAGYGYLTTTKDALIINLAHELNASTAQKGYSSYETVSFILCFIQSLPYTSDSSTEGYDEYPRFPIETLVDGGGDCEDTSILFASVMCILNYTVIYINPPNHVAVGILGDSTVSGNYWTYNGGRYYYCETTAGGYKIGDLPPEYTGQTAKLYPISLSRQYIVNQDAAASSSGLSSSQTVNAPSQQTLIWLIVVWIIVKVTIVLIVVFGWLASKESV